MHWTRASLIRLGFRFRFGLRCMVHCKVLRQARRGSTIKVKQAVRSLTSVLSAGWGRHVRRTYCKCRSQRCFAPPCERSGQNQTCVIGCAVLRESVRDACAQRRDGRPDAEPVCGALRSPQRTCTRSLAFFQVATASNSAAGSASRSAGLAVWSKGEALLDTELFDQLALRRLEGSWWNLASFLSLARTWATQRAAWLATPRQALGHPHLPEEGPHWGEKGVKVSF